MRFFPALLTRAESDALAARADALFEQHGYGLWALEHASSGEFLDFTGLVPIRAGVPGTDGVEIGWLLAGQFWDQGYGTEAARAALGFSFGEPGLGEVHSIATVINRSSRAVMERLGMNYIDD
jgi:RimJ/RimL family protein N-acetyltransferase